MPNDKANDPDDRTDRLPTEVYSKDADYVTLAMKRLTAERMADWLRDAAEVYEIGGADTSAEHARSVANRLEAEVTRDD